MATKKWIIGFLAVAVALTYVMVTFEGAGVRLKVNTASTIFYMFDGSSWKAVGTETINLYNHSTKIIKSATVLGTDNLTSGGIMAWRSTTFSSGALTAQKYFFDSANPDVKSFPINETIEVQDASGLTLRHETSGLKYSGSTYDLHGETELTFGSLKLEFPGGYSFGRVYSTGRVRLDYDINSNYETFKFRMYDPPVAITLYLNGTSANRTVEIGEPLNITAQSNVTGLLVCMSINHSYLGENFTCGVSNVTYTWNPTASLRTINGSNSTMNISYASLSNSTVTLRLHSLDAVNSIKLNLTGVNTSGANWPANVKVYVNNTQVAAIAGQLREGGSTLSTFNDSAASKNISLSSAGSQASYIVMNKNAIVTDAYVNVTGNPNKTLVIDGTTTALGGSVSYDYVIIKNGGQLQVNGTGWLNLTAKNVTVDSTSWINATLVGGNGGGTNCPTYTPAGGTGAGGFGTGGGGGGYGGAGGNGAGPTSGGISYGSSSGATIETGSGGGAGAAVGGNCGGYGGTGAGMVLINSTYIQIYGNITADGTNGQSAGSAGGGGGASGGGVLLYGKYVNINNGNFYLRGGNAGTGISSTGGGGGGGGRFKVFYDTDGTFSNTSSTVSVANGAGAAGGAAGSAGTITYTQAVLNVVKAQSVYIDVKGDGVMEWNVTFSTFGATYFSSTVSNNLSSAISSYLSLCTADTNGNCNVPIILGSNSSGTFNVSNVNVSYTVYFNPVTISAASVQSYLAASSYGYVNVTVKVEANQGNVTVSGINISYNGTGVLNVTAFWAGNATYPANSTTKNLTLYYSDFAAAFPFGFMTEPVWLPLTNSSKNVSAYGQTSTVPEYNITGRNYGKNFNLTFRINQTLSACMNMTMGPNATSYIPVNTTRQVVLTNISVNQTAGIWLRLNLNNCSSGQSYRNIFTEIKTCCIDCMACW
jgi:hypothetical protein